MPRLSKQRQVEMLEAAWNHAHDEAVIGQRKALEKAIAEMIGAAHYLTLRLGKKRAKEIINKLLEVI